MPAKISKFEALALDYSGLPNSAFPSRPLNKNTLRAHLLGREQDVLRSVMLQDLKLRVCSAAIAASGSFGQPGASGYGALVPITFTVLRAFAFAIRRSLPASTWRESPRTGLRALQAHLLAERGALKHNV